MKTKVILSLTISFLLFFIITSSLTKPVIASETIALPATDITDGAGPNILVGKDDTLEFLSALKFSGIDTDRSVTSAYLQLTGESGIAKQMNVAVAENSWSNGAPLLPGLTGPSVNVSLGSPIEYYPENAKYSIDVSPLLMDPSNIGPPSGTISFVLSSDDSSFFLRIMIILNMLLSLSSNMGRLLMKIHLFLQVPRLIYLMLLQIVRP